jgi:hypothetical protein
MMLVVPHVCEVGVDYGQQYWGWGAVAVGCCCDVCEWLDGIDLF